MRAPRKVQINMALVPLSSSKRRAANAPSDLYSRLLEDNLIFNRPPYDQIANLIFAQLLFLEARTRNKPSALHHSPFGSITAGCHLRHDAFHSPTCDDLRRPVRLMARCFCGWHKGNALRCPLAHTYPPPRRHHARRRTFAFRPRDHPNAQCLEHSREAPGQPFAR